MYCTKCGKQLPDDARFCFGCGAAVSVPEPEVKMAPVTESTPAPAPASEPEVRTAPAADAAPAPSPVSDTHEEKPSEDTPKKKKKVGVAVAVVAVLVIAVALLATACFLLFRTEEALPTAISAYIDKDGTAYICYDDGKAVKLGGEVSEAYLTPDGKRIVVAEKKGQVYWTDLNKSQKHKLADTDDNTTVDLMVTNQSVFLAIAEQNTKDNSTELRFSRYDFKSDKTITILEHETKTDGSKDDFYDLFVSDSYGVDDIAIATAQEGVIRVLEPDSEKAEVIASYKNEETIKLCGVSADGKIVVWTSAEEGRYSVVLYHNGTQETVSEGDLDAPSITADNYQSYLSQYLQETYDSEKYATIDAYQNAILKEWGESESDASTDSSAQSGANTDSSAQSGANTDENGDFMTEMPVSSTGSMNVTKLTASQSTIIKKLTDYFRSKSSAPTFNIDVDPNNRVMTINGADRTIFVKGDQVEENKLPSDLHTTLSYSTNGMPLYQDMNVKKAKGYYVVTEDKDTSGTTQNLTVYLIRFADGERVKLVSDISQYSFSEDKLLFVKDDSLRIASIDLKNAELVNERKIANDVYGILVAEANSDYVYFMKNYSSTDNTADLYVYDAKEDESEKIESDVYRTGDVSVDGLNVYYYTDVTSKSATYGTLNVYNVEKEEKDTIAGDVIVSSPTSRLISGELDPKYIWYERYQNSTDTSYDYNICLFNGKESVSVVKNLEA